MIKRASNHGRGRWLRCVGGVQFFKDTALVPFDRIQGEEETAYLLYFQGNGKLCTLSDYSSVKS